MDSGGAEHSTKSQLLTHRGTRAGRDPVQGPVRPDRRWCRSAGPGIGESFPREKREHSPVHGALSRHSGRLTSTSSGRPRPVRRTFPGSSGPPGGSPGQFPEKQETLDQGVIHTVRQGVPPPGGERQNPAEAEEVPSALAEVAQTGVTFRPPCPGPQTLLRTPPDGRGRSRCQAQAALFLRAQAEVREASRNPFDGPPA